MQTLYKIADKAQIAKLTTVKEIGCLLSMFYEISEELGWSPGTQLRDCQTEAVHIAARIGTRLAGGMQLVSSSTTARLPYCVVWPEVTEPSRRNVAHITILALRSEFRAKSGLFWLLTMECWRYCKANALETMRLEATPKTLSLYRRIGWPLRIIGDLRMHWGEPCYLCEMGTDEVADAFAKKAQRCPSYHRLLIDAYRGMPADPNLATDDAT